MHQGKWGGCPIHKLEHPENPGTKAESGEEVLTTDCSGNQPIAAHERSLFLVAEVQHETMGPPLPRSWADISKQTDMENAVRIFLRNEGMCERYELLPMSPTQDQVRCDHTRLTPSGEIIDVDQRLTLVHEKQ